MRIKKIGLLACMILLNNNTQTLDLSRYCCCFEIFKNRDSHKDDAYFFYEEEIDGKPVITFIERQTQQNHPSAGNLTKVNLRTNQAQHANFQQRDLNANRNTIFSSFFTRQNPLDTTNGKHRRKWYGKNNKN